jgi:hypothetical protein
MLPRQRRPGAGNQTAGLRPVINWSRRTTIATTKRMWMNPPSVYELTIPSNHSTNRITKIVQSITSPRGQLMRTTLARRPHFDPSVRIGVAWSPVNARGFARVNTVETRGEKVSHQCHPGGVAASRSEVAAQSKDPYSAHTFAVRTNSRAAYSHAMLGVLRLHHPIRQRMGRVRSG